MTLRPTADPAARAIVCGDPGRAMFLAQQLIDGTPMMFNHHRGLWGYAGPSRFDALPLLVQATGIGGSSAAAVLDDLVELGVEELIRVGSCTSMESSLGAGSLIAVEAVFPRDGTSRAIGPTDGPLRPDASLHGRLIAELGDRAVSAAVQSMDRTTPVALDDQALAWDLQTATLFALAAARHVAAAASLVVAAVPGGQPADDALLEGSFLAAGRSAAAALAG